MEIKRELVAGELRDRRAVALPAMAALGGMIVPAAIYLAFNAGGDGGRGWGIPMATDIAFALGVVALLGHRVPSTVKVLLLTLAIVDDIGAIVVIAVFYTERVELEFVLAAMMCAVAVAVMHRARVVYSPLIAIAGSALWFSVYESGIHATIAGVIMGVLTPARPAQSELEAEELVDVLARLHSVDYEAAGLGEFGRPAGFLARNVARWGKQWEANKTRDVRAIDELARRLEAALPASGPPAIVHGDYRLDNTMLATDDPGRIVAVLDWEMSTVGDPLTDLGLFLVYSGAGSDVAGVRSVSAVSEATGFLAADEIADRYGRATGRDVAHLDFYVVFAFYKLAVILEGINARFQMGKTIGEGFDEIGAGVTALVDAPLARADEAADPALRG